jgi:hypothetical protein
MHRAFAKDIRRSNASALQFPLPFPPLRPLPSPLEPSSRRIGFAAAGNLPPFLFGKE